MTPLDPFDSQAWDDGVRDGRFSPLFEGVGTDAHEDEQDEYSAGFSWGVLTARAFFSGCQAGETGLFCCPLLAGSYPSEDDELIGEWFEGLWRTFMDGDAQGAQA